MVWVVGALATPATLTAEAIGQSSGRTRSTKISPAARPKSRTSFIHTPYWTPEINQAWLEKKLIKI